MVENDTSNDADSVAYQSVEHGHEEPSANRAVPPLSSTMEARKNPLRAFAFSGPSPCGDCLIRPIMESRALDSGPGA